MQNVVNKFVKDGVTANICALDLTKAFDETNYHVLFIKLMKRYIPVDLLDTLEYWLSISCFLFLGYLTLFHLFNLMYFFFYQFLVNKSFINF